MKVKAIKLAEDLIGFINNSSTAFHTVIQLREKLEASGFQSLNEQEKWDLNKGGKYYLTRNNSSIIAFILGRKDVWERGFKIAGAHTDSPSLKIKNEGASVKGGLLRMSVEPYGGGIYATWLDRNLSIAGRIVTENEKGDIQSHYVDLHDPVAIIPNQAIHMNRELNKGFEYNKQNHLQAVLCGVDSDSEEKPAEIFRRLIAEKTNLQFEKIVDMELFLYDVQTGLINGMNNEFISSSRLDNLAMCHSIAQAICRSEKDSDESSMAVFFDNEEIGSNTIQGADSAFLRDIIDRITSVTGGDSEDCYRTRTKSFSISADGAHAHHPNFAESHDPSYAPVLNGGPVIKISSNYKYSTTSETSPVFKKLCREASVPFQEIINRSDVLSGSTIGTISSALTGIKSVDVGSPMFAMHSLRETSGVMDHFYMTEVLKRFFR
ncbi:MAG: M18 family aminopeptidase [Spirochaetaceae bacterium]|jgi:aspartyl aminopeptidase|nr:M18 family aminopeptidase [Spirochaetaceae bacterium]